MSAIFSKNRTFLFSNTPEFFFTVLNFVLAMQNIRTLFAIFLLIPLRASTQQPITWQPQADVSAGGFGNALPHIALDALGNPIVLWGKVSESSVYFARWTGTGFSNPVKLNPAGMTIATASWMGPDMASKGDTVYVVMKQTPESSVNSHIYLVSSFDGGQTFSAPVQVDSIGNNISRFPALSIDPNGFPIVGYMKFDANFMDSRWVITKGLDADGHFAPDILASGWSGANAEVCDCCPGTVVSEGNRTAVLYRDNLSNVRDIWVGLSSNNCESFDQGLRADNNNWVLNTCPASGPDGVLIADTLYSVFMSGGGGGTKCYFSKLSLPDGILQMLPLTGSVPGLSSQNYPKIASFGNAAAIVWKQSVSGGSQLPILFTSDITQGFPAAYDTVDLASITNTDVAVGNGQVFVVWEDDNAGTVKWRTGSFAPTTNLESTNPTASTWEIAPNPANAHFSIQNLENKPVDIRVIDGMGHIQLGKTVFNGEPVDIAHFPAGVYFVIGQTNGQTAVKKLVKIQ